ncbi:MAG TPA: IclR family transcriptional regulator [Acidimicrobiales bacterium]|nr:IclR family transcriptional regulator [Acidimicrobiales bacterium]
MASVSGIGVIDKAVSILDALEGGPRTLVELVEATGLNRATAHRLAVALECHRLVGRDDDGRFVMGPRLIGSTLERVTRPILEDLRDQTGESVQLYVPRNGGRVCVVSIESPHGLRTIVPVGAVLPMDKGSAGKVLREDPAVFKRGYAESVEEREKGVASVSAPVLQGDEVVAAVSVSGPVERTTRAPGKKYALAVIEAAHRIERAMDWL